MDLPEVILAVIGVAVAAGGVTAYYKRSEGMGSIELLQTNIQAYQDAAKLKDQRITFLEAQAYEKDQIIKRLTNEPK